MLIVNPPWQVDNELRDALPVLQECLGRGGYRRCQLACGKAGC